MNRPLSPLTKRRLVLVLWVVMIGASGAAAATLAHAFEEPWHLSRLEQALLAGGVSLPFQAAVFGACWRLLRPLLPTDPEERANALRFLWSGRQKERPRR